MLTMYDSIDVGALTGLPDADALAGYVDGRWPTWHLLHTIAPIGTHLLSIAVFPESDADCLDVEPGDATNAQVYGWFTRQVKRGAHRPCLYTSASNAAALCATMTANGFTRSQFRLWTAHYGVSNHICGPRVCSYPTQADGTQWTSSAHGRNLDQSALHDDFFAVPKPPKPAPVPVPPAEEDTMILVTPDRKLVPAGTDWPGVFFLFSDGTLGHVAPVAGGLDNIKGYQAAGIKGPVTITWDEYLARGGAA